MRLQKKKLGNNGTPCSAVQQCKAGHIRMYTILLLGDRIVGTLRTIQAGIMSQRFMNNYSIKDNSSGIAVLYAYYTQLRDFPIPR